MGANQATAAKWDKDIGKQRRLQSQISSRPHIEPTCDADSGGRPGKSSQHIALDPLHLIRFAKHGEIDPSDAFPAPEKSGGDAVHTLQPRQFPYPRDMHPGKRIIVFA